MGLLSYKRVGLFGGMLLAGILFGGMLFVTSPADAGIIGPSLGQALQTLAPNDEVPVIIRLKDGVAAKHLADNNKSPQKSLRRAKLIRALKDEFGKARLPLLSLLAGNGADEVKSLWLINGVAVTIRAKSIVALAGIPWIDSIVLDGTLSAPVTSMGISSVAGWNLSAIHAPELWQLGFSGQGVVVASLDTGVDIHHADLGPKYRGGDNSWFDPYGQYTSPTDTDGHGSKSMGLIVGGDTSGQVIGVAPGAQWIAAKIFDNNGQATYSVIHQAFQWVLDPDGNPDVDDAPDVVNNSWGFLETVDTCFTEFADDIAVLKAAGIAVVFAGGNSGPNPSTSLSPANNPGSVAVGAVDSSFVVANFSSRGPSACDSGVFPHLSAPGVNVLTTDLTFGGLFPQSYLEVSGTSFSVAHVAGSMTLLLSAFPAATISDIETALQQSAVDMGNAGPDNDYGAGVIDVLGAYSVLAGEPPVVDTDGDGIADTNDNCTLVGNADQLDTDSDGYGNRCDPDFNNDYVVNAVDLAYMKVHFFSNDSLADLTGDGVVAAADLGILKVMFFAAPGPSGIAP